MEAHSLRRTQSLKSLYEVLERSRVMPSTTRWDRKSVSQLVQHYQSCNDLRSSEKEDNKHQTSENLREVQWKRPGNRERVAFHESFRGPGLSKSQSMDFLPQKEASGIRALCALFESKQQQQQNVCSSPQLNSVSAGGRRTGSDCPLQGGRSQDAAIQHQTKPTVDSLHVLLQGVTERGKARKGLWESSDRLSRSSRDDKNSPSLTKGGTGTSRARDRIPTSSSVRDRSALYLSRAAAIDSTGGSTHPDFCTPGTRAKTRKVLCVLN
ncbi:unnamed protein product, partial [Lampetra planeri]